MRKVEVAESMILAIFISFKKKRVINSWTFRWLNA
jgi:hypothetical protein